MKKFYAFAAAAVAALSMNAAPIYVTGASTSFANNWAPDAPEEYNVGADGTYTFELTEVTSIKISTVKGTWDEFNAAALTVEGTVENDKPLPLVAGDANIDMPWKGDYKIVVAGDLSTITLSTETPAPVGFTPVFIRGALNDWGSPAEWQFSTEDGKTYTFVAEGETKIPAGVEFKIADANWGPFCNYSAAGVVVIDEESYWVWDSQVNSTVVEDFEGTITINIPGDKSDAEVLFTAKDTAVKALNVAEGEAEYFNLQGVRVANPENGLYIVRKAGKVTKEVIR